MARPCSSVSLAFIDVRILVVLFWTKYAVPSQIKPEIFKLTIRRGQSNNFVIVEEKGHYRVVLVEELSFDCCSYTAGSAVVRKAFDATSSRCEIRPGKKKWSLVYSLPFFIICGYIHRLTQLSEWIIGIYLHEFTNKERKIAILHEAAECGIENFEFFVNERVQVNSNNSRAISALH